jgi:signal transduction histidine kinase
VQLLQFEKSLSDKQKSHVGEINNAGNLLLELVNQILDLARIEKGHLQLSIEHVSLSNVFSDCRSMITPLTEQDNLSLDINSDINGFVIADYTRLKQVMLNLLSNAIKYNHPGGSVRVSIDVDEAQSLVCIKVEDTGVGIPPEDLEQVFDKFYRSSLNENKVEGTGLGLNLVKQIVEKLHGGRVFAQSQIGSGSVFGFELPLAVKHDLKKSYSVLQD